MILTEEQKESLIETAKYNHTRHVFEKWLSFKDSNFVNQYKREELYYNFCLPDLNALGLVDENNKKTFIDPRGNKWTVEAYVPGFEDLDVFETTGSQQGQLLFIPMP